MAKHRGKSKKKKGERVLLSMVMGPEPPTRQCAPSQLTDVAPHFSHSAFPCLQTHYSLQPVFEEWEYTTVIRGQEDKVSEKAQLVQAGGIQERVGWLGSFSSSDPAWSQSKPGCREDGHHRVHHPWCLSPFPKKSPQIGDLGRISQVH